ncbi:uncharacterized protein LOC106163369 [Lingula anatina]|uniref:Uncharacterized protein LOC106163369 n=1 Tax=Lingula anatina TaxID=7574 RepID=A0A2R2MNC3_LINAN|nr:uncharacterized protein LOC106163369 [Lingula anatina]|eukprot:XP_023931705.1 uncharacterized protein LOC106163369 [Lingula anatina]
MKRGRQRTSHSSSSSTENTPLAKLHIKESNMDKSSRKKEGDKYLITDNTEIRDIISDCLAKFEDKLDAITKTFKDSLKQVEISVKSLDENMTQLDEKVSALETENNVLREQLNISEQRVQSLQRQVDTDHQIMINLQTRSMRDNLLFHNIPETGPQENVENTLRQVLIQQMKIPAEETVSFDRVHRIGSVTNRPKPRAIIAKCTTFHDKRTVMKYTKNLKGTYIRITDQYPKEVEERRRTLYPVMKELRAKNIKHRLVGEKLYINNSLYTPDDRKPDNCLKNLPTHRKNHRHEIKFSEKKTKAKGNSFMGISTRVNSVEDAQSALASIIAGGQVSGASLVYAYRIKSGGTWTVYYNDNNDVFTRRLADVGTG